MLNRNCEHTENNITNKNPNVRVTCIICGKKREDKEAQQNKQKYLRNFKFFHILLTFFSLSFSQSLFTQDLDDAFISNEYYKRTYKNGHNITFQIAFIQSHWIVYSELVELGPINDQHIIPGLKIRYSYHINIYKQFGYYLGSAMMALQESKAYLQSTSSIIDFRNAYGNDIVKSEFIPSLGISFPSANGGFVYALSSDKRVWLGADYSATWYPNMAMSNIYNQTVKLGAILTTLTFHAGVERFFNSTSAMSLEIGWRKSRSCQPSCNKSSFINNFDISNEGWYVSLGASWQVEPDEI